MVSLYTVIFEDKTSYIGDNYFKTGWVEMPNKPIKRIIYTLPNGDNLVLNGYESYFHFCEATYDLSGKNKGKTKLEFDYTIGKIRSLVVCYKINVITGNIEKIIYKEEDKFVKGLNSKGWVGKKKEEEEK